MFPKAEAPKRVRAEPRAPVHLAWPNPGGASLLLEAVLTQGGHLP